jgi:hypothetical protein
MVCCSCYNNYNYSNNYGGYNKNNFVNVEGVNGADGTCNGNNDGDACLTRGLNGGYCQNGICAPANY